MIPEPGLTIQAPFSNHWMSEYGCSTPIVNLNFSPIGKRTATIGCRMRTMPAGALVVEDVREHVVIHEQRRRLADQERPEVGPGEAEPERERPERPRRVPVEEVHLDPRLEGPVEALDRRLGVEPEAGVPRGEHGVLAPPLRDRNGRSHEAVRAAHRAEVVDAVEPDEAVPLVLRVLEVARQGARAKASWTCGKPAKKFGSLRGRRRLRGDLERRRLRRHGRRRLRRRSAHARRQPSRESRAAPSAARLGRRQARHARLQTPPEIGLADCGSTDGGETGKLGADGWQWCKRRCG